LAAPRNVSGTDSPQLVIWDIDLWKQAAAWRYPERTGQQSVDFLGNSDTIVTLADTQGGIAVWRVGSNEPIRTITAPMPIRKCLANKSGDRLYVVSNKGALMLLDPNEPNPAPPAQKPPTEQATPPSTEANVASQAPPAPTYHTSPVRAITLSADGRLAASIDAGGEIILWQTESGRQLGRAQTQKLPLGSTGIVPAPVGAIAFAPDNRTVLAAAVVDALPTVLQLNIESGERRDVSAADERLAVYRKLAQKMGRRGPSFLTSKRFEFFPALLADGKVAVFRFGGGQDRRLIAFDAATGKTLHDAPVDPNWGDQIVVASHSSVGLLSNLSGEATVTLLDLGTAKTRSLALFSHRLFFGAITPDGAAIAALGAPSRPDSESRIWLALGKFSTGNVEHVNAGMQSALAISPDGKRVLTGDREGHLSVWSMRSGKRLATFTLDTQITALACDGHTVAVGDNTCRVHLFGWSQ
jgi:WD40 repeat protein